MVNRLTTQDAAFYFLEAGSTPMHVGSLGIFRQPGTGIDHNELLRLVEERLSLVPRYRQKVREVVLGLARPVWVDDRDFDITYHVRRSALPKPGSAEQLNDLIARLISRPLDNTRPLWEMYLVEGLADDRFAIFTKSHSALVDGDTALEISQVLFDPQEKRSPGAEELWMPAPPPSDLNLLIGALADLVTSPGEGVARARAALGDVTTSMTEAVSAVGKVAAVVRTAAQVAPNSPLNAPISRSRRLSVAKTPLNDYRRIRAKYGCEINDVILTVVTGALRNWLLSRGEPVTEASVVRAMVPMSVYIDGPDSPDVEDPQAPGHVSSFLIDLPVGEPNAVVRLSHVAHATEAFARQGRRVTAQTMVKMSGFAPATLHAMSARAASSLSQRMFNLMITNAPGPQFPLYIGGARMEEMYPVSPLLKNQTLSIALTSYDGNVYYGLNADRDAMSDVDVVRSLLFESLEELTDASR
ncbi:wax ester/triacylglycerol synthase family O-acyltransferase [Rhodococcus sp. KBS0724]|jgi:WS/DGAT/MGAT family acyltransferase|uniref:WS/DGAT/MGAT family O-acyltransferase n=1 Tax=Rhodococcus sp. KBS0724 TaxID=1179674 RepID=UPI00110DEAFC|nr:wax ester/triacylglycerol synthase family O-acyltransferase [Rhodococcus sp. KBS0724]TSD48160.1 wax ester/triacylglycerol synthase family O-acyltransferase [Rhodococcus sp. KBS0724]